MGRNDVHHPNENRKNDRSAFVNIINSNGGDIKDWSNYPHVFNDFEDAKKECESIIKGGRYKARNVRILKVVCKFDSEIIVKASESHDN